MKIQKIDSSASFKAVNEKYLEMAKKQYSKTGKILPDLFQKMSYDVFKHQTMYYRDAIDTVKAIRAVALDIGGAGEAFFTTLIKNKPQFKVKK